MSKLSEAVEDIVSALEKERASLSTPPASEFDIAQADTIAWAIEKIHAIAAKHEPAATCGGRAPDGARCRMPAGHNMGQPDIPENHA